MSLRIQLLLILTLCGSVPAAERTDASFDCKVATTRQDASLDWWYAVPSVFTPKLTPITKTVKGEYFNVIPFFRNYGISTNGQAVISYDLEMIRPDGSIDTVLTKCDGHTGPTASPKLIPARAVVRIYFDSEDPYGTYTINVTAYDRISNQTNRQSIKIEQLEFRLQSTTAQERDQIFITYSTAPDPARALACFLQTEQSFIDQENEPVWSAIHFYKTIFEQNEYLIPHLLAAFHNTTPKHQKDIIFVLALMKRTEELPKRSEALKNFEEIVKAGRVPNPYDKITTAKQLDMLWAEFFATGKIKPIRQILTALNLIQYSGTLTRVKSGELDRESPAVIQEAIFESVFQSALWSLRSNCRQSPLLFQYAVGILESEELDKPAQACLAVLLKVIAEEHEKAESEPKG